MPPEPDYSPEGNPGQSSEPPTVQRPIWRSPSYEPPASPPPQALEAQQGFPSPEAFPAPQGFPSPQAYQAPQGFPSPQAFQAPQGSPPPAGFPSVQGFPSPSGFPSPQGFPPPQGIPGPQDFAAPPVLPPPPEPSARDLAGPGRHLRPIRSIGGIIWGAITVILAIGAVLEFSIGVAGGAVVCLVIAIGTGWYDYRIWRPKRPRDPR